MTFQIRDILHAARTLAKAKAFTAVCIISLGLGMGAVVALATFSRALTSPARGIDTNGLAEVLVLPEGPLRAKAGIWALERWSYPDYQVLRDADVGMDVTGWSLESSEFGGPAPNDNEAAAPRIDALYVSANYFRTFGVPLARGAGFDSTDDSPSAEPRVILSDDFWKSRVAADPDIVGKTLKIDGVMHTVVGVTPPDFRGHFHFFVAPGSMFFLPLERHPRLRQNPNLRDDRSAEWVRIHGRLHAGVDMTRARALVSTAMATIAKQYPATNQFKSATVEPYASLGAAQWPESRRVFGVLFSLAGAVLLIVCLNISGMMLVRGAKRERELSIRVALGANRATLIRYLFFEAVFLAVMAGGLAAFVLFGIPAVAGWWLGAPVPQEVDFDKTSAAIAMALCLVVSVLFGLLPALRFSRPSVLPALKDDTGGGGTQTIRIHRYAAMAQIAIAVPFLVVSGVMIDRVRTADFGFATDGIAGARVPADKNQHGAIRKVRDNLKQAIGVRSVSVAEGMPIDFDYREFRVARADKAEYATAHVTRVDENFLATVGAPLLRGRWITADDRMMNAPVAVISAPLAKELFPDTEPVGQQVSATLEESREQLLTIVGVTGDFASSQLTTTRMQILLPMRDVSAAPQSEIRASTVYLIVRGGPGDEPKLRSALETALRDLGVEPLPGVAFPGIVTGTDMVDKSKQDLIGEGTAVGIVGGLVLVLAALGIVGVVGFMVATRTREFAVRMALGSTRRRVFTMMVTDTVKLVVPGIVIGLVIGAVLIRRMDNVMGTPLTVGPTPLGVAEPVIYAVASAMAIIVAVLAGLPAARRATSIQPMAAIRSE
jgi:predicted permease